MAKVSAVQRNLKRTRLIAKFATKRAELKAIIMDKTVSQEEAFQCNIEIGTASKE